MLNRLMLTLIFLSIAFGAAGLWLLMDAPLEKFHVKGDLTAREQIKVTDTLRELDLGGVLSVDIRQVREHLEEMGWAREVSVRRVWPVTLEVSMLKESPVAHWGDGQFIAASGNLLSLPDEYPQLPRFDVGVSSPKEAMKVYRLVSHLAAESELNVVGLVQDAQGGWNIEFDSGVKAFLGAERLSERMQRFNKIYADTAVNAQPVAYMDLRYNNGVAVKHVDEDVELEEAVLVAGTN